MKCEVYVSTLSIGYSGSPSTVNETNCNPIPFKLVPQMGSSTCSPESRWRRFLIKTTVQNRIQVSWVHFLPDLFKVKYYCSWYFPCPSGKRCCVLSSCTSSSISLQFCSVHPIASCEKSIVNTCKMPTLRIAASFPRIPGHMVLLFFLGFAVSSTMATPFLDHVVRDRECIQF